MIQSAHHKQFERCIRSISRSRSLWEVFGDVCEISAISLSNSLIPNPDREKRYLDIVSRYNPEEVRAMPELLGITVNALSEMDCDFLGEMFMHLELASHWQGQFFTPFNICRMMAEMTVVDLEEVIQRKGFVTCQEPSAGSGAMIIALAKACKEKKINYQQCLHVTAIDISSTAAYMAYIQLTLLHVPALVYVGDALRNKMREVWVTPAHVMGLWDYRLKQYHPESPKPTVPKIKPQHQETIPLFPPDLVIERSESKEPIRPIRKKQRNEILVQPSFFS